MNNTWKPSLTIFMIAMMLAAGAASAKEEFCVKAKEDMQWEMVTAKVPLYQTKIDRHEIRKLERDGDEIRKGSQATIKDIGCGAKKVEVTLKPDGPGDSVEIYFFISRDERLKPGAREDFEHMMTYVFEEVPGAEGSGDDGN